MFGIARVIIGVCFLKFYVVDLLDLLDLLGLVGLVGLVDVVDVYGMHEWCG